MESSIDDGVVLRSRSLAAGYGGKAAIEDINIEVAAGEIVALMGPNASGKTTTLLALSGELLPLEGEVEWLGRTTSTPLYRRAREGLSLVTSQGSLFLDLTVRDNLRLGRGGIDRAVEHFPVLGDLIARRAGLLSGGEQRMLALGRALAGEPRLLLADEMSLGLAPAVVKDLMIKLREAAAASGTAVLLVEQQARHALRVADRGYVLRRGRIALAGSSTKLAENDFAELESLYLSDRRPNGGAILVNRVTGRTQVCCILGTPVAHSISPAVHNRVYEMLDLDYAYVPFDVPDVGAALDAVRSLGIRGAAISIPYKEAAVPHLDEVDDTSAKIGAVNSVRNDAGRLVGFNTDVSGAMAALAEVGGVPGARVALLGAGGSARAIAYGLRAEGCGPVHVFNRTIERGERLVRELDLEGAHGLSDPRLVRECDIVINATSVGLGESDASPISEDCLREGQIVFDIVYHPRDTRLLRAARSAGSRVVYGERMLLHGVAHQIAFFTGVEPELAVVETALQAAS